jgi:hypothetical protein
MTIHHFNLFADYFQFYVQDEEALGLDILSREDIDRMFAVAPGYVWVGTARNMHVPVTIEILEAEPALDLESWHHVTECSIDIPSGKLVVAGCTDYFPDAARIGVAPGTYRARVSGGGFDTVDGLEGAESYRVQLWPGTATEPTVLKQFSLQ